MDQTTNQTQQSPKTKKRVRKLPESDINLADVARQVAQIWQNKNLNLQWITAADFKTLVDDFSAQLQVRMQEGTLRPQITARLKELDKTINKHLSYVKNYLIEEVGKNNAPAYYAQLGIERIGSVYKLPTDRNNRQSALQMLIKGIAERGYGDRTYGTAFWQVILDEYTKLMNQAVEMDSAISDKVNIKNQTKDQVKKVLNALIYLIRANYPDSFNAELRIWGFHKEKY